MDPKFPLSTLKQAGAIACQLQRSDAIFIDLIKMQIANCPTQEEDQA